MCESNCKCGHHAKIDTNKPVKLFSGFVEALGEMDAWHQTFSDLAVQFFVENETFMVEKVDDHYKVIDAGIELNDFELENAE